MENVVGIREGMNSPVERPSVSESSVEGVRSSNLSLSGLSLSGGQTTQSQDERSDSDISQFFYCKCGTRLEAKRKGYKKSGKSLNPRSRPYGKNSALCYDCLRLELGQKNNRGAQYRGFGIEKRAIKKPPGLGGPSRVISELRKEVDISGLSQTEYPSISGSFRPKHSTLFQSSGDLPERRHPYYFQKKKHSELPRLSNLNNLPGKRFRIANNRLVGKLPPLPDRTDSYQTHKAVEVQELFAVMADKDSYICALEKKLAELSGIELDQIKKNQLANAADEARAISEMAAYVAGITVQQAGIAQAGVVSPQIATIYAHINSELNEARGSHALPPLKYDYNALEPHISGTIMEIHHTKHHQAYITNLKAATEKLLEAETHNDISAMNALLPAIKFNGGGHLNHTIFWTNMSPNGGGEPTGPVAEAINAEFGSFQAFKDKFSTASVGVKGSGWGWLGYCSKHDKVAIATCQNQDPLQLTHGLVPLLGLDVWEHAYYLQYKNLRADYVKAFFNVINWSNVNERFENARKAAGH